MNLGNALEDQFNLYGAQGEYSEALNLDPSSPVAHFSKGRTLFDLGKLEEAQVELRAASELRPDYAAPIYLLALVEKRANRVSKSTDLLQRVIALEPRNADAQYLLGENLLDLGKTDLAIRHWKLALDANPSHREALYSLSRAVSKSKSVDPEAKRYADLYTGLFESRQGTDWVRTLNDFALEAANARNWPNAVTHLKEALETCGHCSLQANLHRDLGLVYCHQGQMEAGEHELWLALKLRPNDADTLNAMQAVGALRNK